MNDARFRAALFAAILAMLLGCDRSEVRLNMVLLADQRLLTKAEYDAAITAWSQGKKSFEERETYLKSKQLDPTLYMPGEGWGDIVTNPFREFLVEKPSQARANQHRLHTQSFTGYSLYLMDWAEGKPPAPDLVPAAAFDAKHRGRKIDTDLYEDFGETRRFVPEKYLARVPRVMGEIGWDLDGYTLSHDTVPYLDALRMMYSAGVLDWIERRIASGRSVTVLEIGSGYGGFPYLFVKAFPQVRYWGCDLAEVLGVAGMYLSVSLPDRWRGIHPDSGPDTAEGISLIANHRFEEFAKSGRKVDLVINMMSLSEMPEKQIKYYGRKVSELIADDGVFFEQNFDNRHLGWSNASDHLIAFFKARRNLGVSFRRGRTHLWANNPAVLSAIRVEGRLDTARSQSGVEWERWVWIAPALLLLGGLLAYRFLRRRPKPAPAGT